MLKRQLFGELLSAATGIGTPFAPTRKNTLQLR